MLTKSQENYLSKIPDDKEVVTRAFNPEVKIVAASIIKDITGVLPEVEVFFGGAAALGISGQNDIDISILSEQKKYEEYLPLLEKIFGEPSLKGTSIKWEFRRSDFDVELYLTDKNSDGFKEQIRVFEILERNKDLRDEYEKIKLPFGKVKFKEYMTKKYEFFNRILKDFS